MSTMPPVPTPSEQLQAEIDLTRRIVLCSALYKAGVWDQLLDCAETITADAPERAEGHFYRGLALLHHDRDDEGLGEMREAVRLDPANRNYSEPLAAVVSDRGSRPLVVLLDAALRAGELEEAAELARRRTHVAPRAVAGWLGLAAVHLGRGEHRDALRAATRALETSPEDETAAALVRELLKRVE
jgi:tetratricopeptide (TPR) repeat protein